MALCRGIASLGECLRDQLRSAISEVFSFHVLLAKLSNVASMYASGAYGTLSPGMPYVLGDRVVRLIP